MRGGMEASGRTWGSVQTRENANGTVTWRGRYASPRDGRSVVRSFPSEAEARAWLTAEHDLVSADRHGSAVWTHPSEREAKKRACRLTFEQWARSWFDRYGSRRDGEALAPATLRYKRLALERLVRSFGPRPLASIAVNDVNRWLEGCRLENAPKRTAYIMLRAIMAEAASPRDGSAPLIERSPCLAPVPRKAKSGAALVPPATPAQIDAIWRAMPDWDRIAVHLAVTFGLRASEICALMVRDVDLGNMTLHLRHSARRGEGDVGPLRVSDMKTEASADDMPIPRGMAGELERHIAAHCLSDPEAMLIRTPHGGVLNPNTLRHQFDKARLRAGRPDLRLHTLRATAITQAVREGAEPKEVQRFGRHADPEVSLEHYQRARGEDERRELSDRVYLDLVGGPRTARDVRAQIDGKLRRLRRLQDEIEDLMALQHRLEAAGR